MIRKKANIFEKIEFIFKVTAEDRNGSIIAESRGMTSGSPRFFNR